MRPFEGLKNRIDHILYYMRSKRRCFICGYVEGHGNFVDEFKRSVCDECIISGDYLDTIDPGGNPIDQQLS